MNTDFASITTLDELVAAVMPLPTKVQKSYTWHDDTFEGGDKTDPTSELAQSAAYFAGAVLGANTREAAAALGFVGPKQYRTASNRWADAHSDLERRMTLKLAAGREARAAKAAEKQAAKAPVAVEEPGVEAPKGRRSRKAA